MDPRIKHHQLVIIPSHPQPEATCITSQRFTANSTCCYSDN
jgi:hypothetical protein